MIDDPGAPHASESQRAGDDAARGGRLCEREPTHGDEAGAARLFAAWKEWLEARPLGEIVPKERAVEALRRLADEKTVAGDVTPRIERAVDALEKRLRGLDRSAAQLLGPALAERIVAAAADLEPDERAARAFFEQRAVADLLGSVVYDGIVEFIRKANQLSDLLPGISTAKKLAGGVGGLLGALGGGLAGAVAGGLREELEKKLEGQVRTFLAGFGQVAVDRAIRFAIAPQNRKLFREMRIDLAKRVLNAPVRDLMSSVPPARVQELKRKLVDAAAQAAADERAKRRGEAELERLAAAHGGEKLADAVRRLGGELLPTDPLARLLAPGLAKFLATPEARSILAGG